MEVHILFILSKKEQNIEIIIIFKILKYPLYIPLIMKMVIFLIKILCQWKSKYLIFIKKEI